MMHCPSENDLARAMATAPPRGESDLATWRAMEEHMSSCADCRLLVFAISSRSRDKDSEHLVPLSANTKLARFTLGRELGRGAMGVVYLSRDPDLERDVALKVCHQASALDAELEERLRREAQSLARLSHGNVVTIYEVGSHAGRVFIVMEFVEGVTLHDWLALRARSVGEILSVFRQALSGLQAAHKAGLIHRDFKPRNLIVSENSEVKITDFGLVRLPNGLSEEPKAQDIDLVLSQTGAMIGTPAYMAPEQLSGLPATPLSDQFSFAVTLYEALTGTRPFLGRTVAELATAMNSQLPRALTVSGLSGRSRRAILRALHPDAAQRFPDLQALAQELSPPQRRWAWAGLGGAFIAAAMTAQFLGFPNSGPSDNTCGGTTKKLAAVWGASDKLKLRTTFSASALPYARESRVAIARVLDEYGAAWHLMRKDSCEATQRKEQSPELLDLRMACLDQRLSEMSGLIELFTNEPTDAVIESSVVAVHGLPLLGVCADGDYLRASVPPPQGKTMQDSVDALRTLLSDAGSLKLVGSYVESLEIAERVQRESAAIAYPPIQAEALFVVGDLQDENGLFKEAEASLFQAAEIAAASKDDYLVARIWIELVFVIGTQQADTKRIQPIVSAAKTAVARVQGDAGLAADLQHNLCNLLVTNGDYKRALRRCELALDAREALQGPDHPRVAAILNDLGYALQFSGELERASTVYKRAMEIWARELGASHPRTAIAVTSLGNVMRLLGRHAEARDYYERGLEIRQRSLAPNHPKLASSYYYMGIAREYEGRYDESREFYDRSLSIRKQLFGTNHTAVASTLVSLGILLKLQEKFEEASRHFEQALAIQEELLGPNHANIGVNLVNLAETLDAQGDFAQAIIHCSRAETIFKEGLGEGHPFVAYALTCIGRARLNSNKASAAISVLEQALTIRVNQETGVADIAESRLQLARALWDSKRSRKRARQLAEEAQKALTAETDHHQAQDLLATVDTWLKSHPEP